MEKFSIKKHRQYVETRLKTLDKKSIYQYIALTLEPFLYDRIIMDFLMQLNPKNPKQIKILLSKIIAKESIDKEFYQKFFVDLTWNIDDCDHSLFYASEGASRFLGSIELLLACMNKYSLVKAINASFVFLDQAEYYQVLCEEDDCLYKKSMELYDKEINRQISLLNDNNGNILTNNRNQIFDYIEYFYKI